jgi:GH25 family lysozyme M1 (1,4-beta-N-acetylmuramidase)
MGDTVETPISGQVTVTARANLRQGAPNTQAPVIRKLDTGTFVHVVAVAAGEPVQGNAQWYRTDDNGYLWAGACGPVQTAAIPSASPTAALPVLDRMARLNRTPMVVDLSHGDGVTSFADAKAAGLVGVIHKATTGATGRDDAYRDRKQAALDAGLLWGAYHWGTAAPIADQINNFLDWARPDASTLVALDFEPTVGNQMTLDGARAYCQTILDTLGRRTVIYSGDTLKSGLGTTVDPFFGAHRLWLAQYGNRPTVQRSWSSFWLWQYTDGALGPGAKSVPGLPGDAQGRLDCDYFDGDAVVLAASWAS